MGESCRLVVFRDPMLGYSFAVEIVHIDLDECELSYGTTIASEIALSE